MNGYLSWGKEVSGKTFLVDIAFKIAFSALLILLFKSFKRWYAILAMLIILTVNFIQESIKLGNLINYKTTNIYKGTWFDILSTNHNEYTEYLKAFHTTIVLEYAFIGLLVILLLLAFIFHKQTIKFSFKRLIGFVAIFCGIIYTEHKYSDQLNRGVFTFFELRKEAAAFNKNVMDRDKFFKNIKYNIIDTQHCPQKIIIVIGESLSRLNMSLYDSNYKYNTNPLLKTHDDLLLFNNVCTPYASTGLSLNYTLTFGSHQNPELKMKAPSIVEVLKAAGYKTKWITTPGVYADFEYYTGVGNLYLQIGKTCDTLINLHSIQNVQDEAVLKPLKEEYSKNEKQVIFVHLLGSHLQYQSRYPSRFRKWVDDTTKKSTSIQKYNNTVYYNDYVIDSVFKIAQTYDNNLTCYFSDHGDLASDECENGYLAHNAELPNLYSISVPFMFLKSKWYKTNTYFQQTYLANKNKEFSIEDLVHCIYNITTMSGNYIDTSKSIFSKSYKEISRKVNDKVYYRDLIKTPCGKNN